MSNNNNQFAVKVVPNSDGRVIRQNPNKSEYGSIMFEQVGYRIRNNFLNIRKKVSFITGTMSELEQFSKTSNLTPGGIVPGCLYTVESFTPFYENQEPKLNPSTGRACLVDGAMVWSKTFYDPSGSQTDAFLNGEPSEGDVVRETGVVVTPEALRSITLS